MRRILVFWVVCGLLWGCKFEVELGDLVFWSEDASMDNSADSTEDVVSEEVDVELDAIEPGDVEVFETTDLVDMVEVDDHVIDVPDVQPDESVINPCDEDEYPDPILKKCLKYPCCDLGGPWIFELTDPSFEPWKVYVYTGSITQVKAYLIFEIKSSGSSGNRPLPTLLEGTLEGDVLHLEGGNMAETGFLVMDANKVGPKMFQLGEISGTYKLIISGEPTLDAFFNLIPNF